MYLLFWTDTPFRASTHPLEAVPLVQSALCDERRSDRCIAHEGTSRHIYRLHLLEANPTYTMILAGSEILSTFEVADKPGAPIADCATSRKPSKLAGMIDTRWLMLPHSLQLLTMAPCGIVSPNLAQWSCGWGGLQFAVICCMRWGGRRLESRG